MSSAHPGRPTAHDEEPPDALGQDGTYPRPQLVRGSWCDLSGGWDFAIDHAFADSVDHITFDRTIIVPYPPESPASGLHEPGFLPCVWYRRTFGADQLAAGGHGGARSRVLLHFGAVDYAATVWVNGHLVATHEGGQTPFAADVTTAIDPTTENVLVVRAIDRPEDVSVPRGKQDWQEQAHSIWHHRTTGIWQPVWLECVPSASIDALTWRTDLLFTSVGVDVELESAEHVPLASSVRVRLFHQGELLAEAAVKTLGKPLCPVRLVLSTLLNGQRREELLWTPERPVLIGATVTLEAEDGSTIDAVSSYLGLRTVLTGHGRLLINDRPTTMRAVLAQNYWPETHLAATPEALRREVELILDLGFNTARVHQKAEDPRFLYWADRLGLMIWAETANAYAFDHRAVASLVSEWTTIVLRDQSHPAIIAWVPLNESWGVPHISQDERQQAFARSIADLTRALDGSRPVVSNDGWEHVASDICTIHDYEPDPVVLATRYGDSVQVQDMLRGFGPAGRRMTLGTQDTDVPIMLTEFGGVSLASGTGVGWGYSAAADTGEFEQRVTAIIRAIAGAVPLAGFCYTQLTDTAQETNGLLYADRTPKFPIDRIRAAVRGE